MSTAEMGGTAAKKTPSEEKERGSAAFPL